MCESTGKTSTNDNRAQYHTIGVGATAGFVGTAKQSGIRLRCVCKMIKTNLNMWASSVIHKLSYITKQKLHTEMCCSMLIDCIFQQSLNTMINVSSPQVVYSLNGDVLSCMLIDNIFQ
jgi:hypothetical protein